MKTVIKVALILFILTALFNCSSDDEPTQNPNISGISPNNGPKTTIVTINGNDFGTEINNVKVFFNGVEGIIQELSNTSITAEVPPKAFTGLVKVIIDGVESVGPKFTYIITDVNVSTILFNGNLLSNPTNVAIDSQKNIYVVELGNHRILKITPSNVVSIFAGSIVGQADGVGVAAQFSIPRDIAIDNQDNLYITDNSNTKIRKITPNGVVSTLAGSTQGTLDGTGSDAKFDSIRGIIVNSNNTVFVTNTDEDGLSRLRKITQNGVVTSLNITNNVNINSNSRGLTIDKQDNIYVIDNSHDEIIKIAPNNQVSIINTNSTDLDDLRGITIDEQKNIYVVNNNKVQRITPSGDVTTIAGSVSGFQDGIGNLAKFSNPLGITIDSDRNIYVADFSNNVLRKITQE